MSRPRIRLTFEFELDADPVSGVVLDGSGAGEPFSGWMELARRIEVSLAAARDVSAASVAADPLVAPPEAS